MAVAPCLLAKANHTVLSLLHGFAFAELSLGSERRAPAVTLLQCRSSGTPLLGQLLCRIRREMSLFVAGKSCVPSRPLDPPQMMLGGDLASMAAVSHPVFKNTLANPISSTVSRAQVNRLKK